MKDTTTTTTTTTTTSRSSSKQKTPLLFTSKQTEDEILVAQILLDLPKMIEAFESPPSFKWGLKRRRSALDEGAPSSREPSPSTYDEIEHRKPRIKAADGGVCGGAAASASPVTPLSFSPSESDEKSRHALKKCSKKRPREEYIDTIEELTQRRDLLKGEIANVTKYYNKLNAYNSQLKSMKQEVLNSCHKKEKPELEITAGMNLGGELTHNHQKCVVAHQQPLIVDQMAENFQYSIGPFTAQFYSSNNGLGPVNDVGPLGIPDLNLSAEEVFVLDASQPLDMSRVLADRRARFAEARRRRKGIIKIKSMRSACGIKLPGNR